MITEKEQKELDRFYEMLDKNLGLLWEAIANDGEAVYTKDVEEDFLDMVYITALIWKSTIKE